MRQRAPPSRTFSGKPEPVGKHGGFVLIVGMIASEFGRTIQAMAEAEQMFAEPVQMVERNGVYVPSRGEW